MPSVALPTSQFKVGTLNAVFKGNPLELLAATADLSNENGWLLLYSKEDGLQLWLIDILNLDASDSIQVLSKTQLEIPYLNSEVELYNNYEIIPS